MLEAHGVSKRFGRNREALAAVTLAVPRGSIVGLVGPNAAGKSTLMRAFVGFERPTAGWVRVCGVDPQVDRRQALDHLAYVAQTPMLYRELTVRQHLDLAMTMRGTFDRGIAERRLDELDVPLDVEIGRLSGGQAAQVSLGIALGTRADVLVLDEPLASLDPLARREFLDILTDEVRTQGTTALLSSHVVSDVERGCDRIIVLGTGRVLLDERLSELTASHRVVHAEDLHAIDSVRPIGPVEATGGRAWLVFSTDQGVGVEATIEQVVLGYLASARRPGPPA